jgi:hypothetical protein
VKSGVARLCSIMIEMYSHVGSYGLARAMQEDPYATVRYIIPRICT